MTENEKGSFRKVIGDGDTLHFVGLSDEEEAKIIALHDVETIRILRACTEDAQFLTANREQTFQIALALFDKRCDKIYTWIERALDNKAQAGELK